MIRWTGCFWMDGARDEILGEVWDDNYWDAGAALSAAVEEHAG